jgi:hypothetical protein
VCWWTCKCTLPTHRHAAAHPVPSRSSDERVTACGGRGPTTGVTPSCEDEVRGKACMSSSLSRNRPSVTTSVCLFMKRNHEVRSVWLVRMQHKMRSSSTIQPQSTSDAQITGQQHFETKHPSGWPTHHTSSATSSKQMHEPHILNTTQARAITSLTKSTNVTLSFIHIMSCVCSFPKPVFSLASAPIVCHHVCQ